MTEQTPLILQATKQVRLSNGGTRRAKALTAHRQRQDLEREKLGATWDVQGFVFTNRLGWPLDGIHVLRRALRPLLQRAGLPSIRFHDLRHTAATLLLMQGVNPKVDSEVLGHSDVSITLAIYSHVLPDLQRLAADAMNNALDPTDDN
jgi:integrase